MMDDDDDDGDNDVTGEEASGGGGGDVTDVTGAEEKTVGDENDDDDYKKEEGTKRETTRPLGDDDNRGLLGGAQKTGQSAAKTVLPPSNSTSAPSSFEVVATASEWEGKAWDVWYGQPCFTKVSECKAIDPVKKTPMRIGALPDSLRGRVLGLAYRVYLDSILDPRTIHPPPSRLSASQGVDQLHDELWAQHRRPPSSSSSSGSSGGGFKAFVSLSPRSTLEAAVLAAVPESDRIEFLQGLRSDCPSSSC
uniref:Uncharacterized protein n=1 Tax=Octactis speculum TaxID=3111310 RepID=A0A7S2BK10_9STRA|mmetsp:Transcript_24119/g.32982  ORF Transcript_24119/g.32982 Transcript_24119/m.32982 type:complete len:250 (+) Transcript_24119:673-1422(+)